MTDAPVYRSTYRAPADTEPEQPAQSRALSVAVLVILIAVALSVGFLGSLATQEHVDGWYENADNPAWTPPGIIFGPVWSVLYITMAVAAWLVWRRRDEANVRPALTGYVIQLAINSIWSPVFFALYPTFGVGALWWAFGIILVLIVAVVYTLVVFWRVERWAGILLIPYLAWLLYASTLNAGVAVLQS